MKKLYSYSVFMLLLILATQVNKVSAQRFTIGTSDGFNGPAEYPSPLGDAKEATRTQYLFRASELTAAGMSPGRIYWVEWNVTNLNSMGLMELMEVKIGTTAVNDLDAISWLPGAVAQYGPQTYAPTLGLNQFNFPSNFYWDGVSNIFIEVCHGNFDAVVNNYASANAEVAYTTTTFNSSHTYAADDVPSGCGDPTTTNTGNQKRRPVTNFYLVPDCNPPIGPVTTSVTAKTATVSWNSSTSVPSAIKAYRYTLSTTSPVPDVGTNGFTNVGNTTTTTIPNLKPNTKYYIGIQTICNDGLNEFSEWLVDSFTTWPDCVSPSVTIDRIYGNRAVASWPAVETAHTYEYAVSIDMDQTPVTGGIKTQYTSVELLGLKTDGVRYNFWIRALCSPTPSSEWIRAQFWSGKELSVEDADGNNVMKLYPNPATDIITIDANLSTTATPIVSIADISGRVVMIKELKAERTNLDISSLAPGMYFVKYANDKQTEVLKFTKE
jgi:hypothetical protein